METIGLGILLGLWILGSCIESGLEKISKAIKNNHDNIITVKKEILMPK